MLLGAQRLNDQRPIINYRPVSKNWSGSVLGGSHSGNVSAKAVAQAGLLDGLSSDYVPSSLLDAVFRLVDELEMSVPDATQVVTKNPADMVGLTDRGSITLGQRADLVWVRRLRGATPVVRQVWRQGVRVC